MTQLTSSRRSSPEIRSSHRHLMRSACIDPCETTQSRQDGMEIRQTVQCGRLLMMVRELIDVTRWRGPQAAIPQYRGRHFHVLLKRDQSCHLVLTAQPACAGSRLTLRYRSWSLAFSQHRLHGLRPTIRRSRQEARRWPKPDAVNQRGGSAWPVACSTAFTETSTTAFGVCR